MGDAADDLEMMEINQEMGVGFCKRHNPELGLWPHECPQCREEDSILKFGDVVINKNVSYDNPIRVLIFLREQAKSTSCLCLTGNGDVISLHSNFLEESGSIDLDRFYRVRFEELGKS